MDSSIESDSPPEKKQQLLLLSRGANFFATHRSSWQPSICATDAAGGRGAEDSGLHIPYLMLRLPEPLRKRRNLLRLLLKAVAGQGGRCLQAWA